MFELVDTLFHDFRTENKAFSFNGPSLCNKTPEGIKIAFKVNTLNPFEPITDLFLYPLKTQKQGFSVVFRGYKKDQKHEIGSA